MDVKETVYARLAEMGIGYEVVEHGAVYTIEEMAAVPFADDVEIVKNLFLRDNKGKRHFLVLLPGDKAADLKHLRTLLGSTPLSFASEDRLMKHLGLTKGAVTPFGLLNNEDHKVEVVLDKALLAKPRVGVHPNDNTATVLLSPADMVRVVEECGNPLVVLDI